MILEDGTMPSTSGKVSSATLEDACPGTTSHPALARIQCPGNKERRAPCPPDREEAATGVEEGTARQHRGGDWIGYTRRAEVAFLTSGLRERLGPGSSGMALTGATAHAAAPSRGCLM